MFCFSPFYYPGGVYFLILSKCEDIKKARPEISHLPTCPFPLLTLPLFFIFFLNFVGSSLYLNK